MSVVGARGEAKRQRSVANELFGARGGAKMQRAVANGPAWCPWRSEEAEIGRQ
ncbi:hypothetical protein [Mesobacillus campisalis]|uniref:hypothetical protein n=1 Tax=Mesobacillus campisalis TaxID=1408103 RepID=UPI0012E19532|nr:hypothetical protein [Mesobacillus campisalis]